MDEQRRPGESVQNWIRRSSDAYILDLGKFISSELIRRNNERERSKKPIARKH